MDQRTERRTQTAPVVVLRNVAFAVTNSLFSCTSHIETPKSLHLNTMSHPSAGRLTSVLFRHRQAISQAARPFSTQTTISSSTSTTADLPHTTTYPGPGTEKRFVRIAGPSSYATKTDLELFLASQGVKPETPTDSPEMVHGLVQGQSDVFQNQSIWIYDAGSAAAAADVASRVTGRIAGLKLVRAAPVDLRIVEEMLAVPTAGSSAKKARTSLRKRMNVIRPKPDERGRALLATNLPFNMSPRMLWGFFASYELVSIRHLRKSGVACLVFSTVEEAYRGMRERANLPIQGNKQHIALKLHQ